MVDSDWYCQQPKMVLQTAYAFRWWTEWYFFLERVLPIWRAYIHFLQNLLYVHLNEWKPELSIQMENLAQTLPFIMLINIGVEFLNKFTEYQNIEAFHNVIM